MQTTRWARPYFSSLFDAADPEQLVDRRTVSTVAPQSLFFLNHPFVAHIAQQFAGRLLSEATDNTSRVQRAYECLFARLPSTGEEQLAVDYLERNAWRGATPVGPISCKFCWPATSFLMSTDPFRQRLSRREALCLAGTGFGALALQGLLAQESPATDPRALNPLAPLPTHHAPRAERCLFLYMPGGPSQLDLFDPKPRLTAEDGKPVPFEKPKLERTKTGNIAASPWKFAQHGQSGIEISELLPALGRLCRRLVRDPIDGGRQHQPYRRRAANEYGRRTLSASQPGFVADLWTWNRERKPAGLCRD